MLINMGYRVICPDLMGYGGTDAPRVPPESTTNYTLKRAAEDMNQLARTLGSEKIILGGHDWVRVLMMDVGTQMTHESRVQQWHTESHSGFPSS